MIKYEVTLTKNKELFQAAVEIEDQGGPVQNNGAAIKAALAQKAAMGLTGLEPSRVVRL